MRCSRPKFFLKGWLGAAAVNARWCGRRFCETKKGKMFIIDGGGCVLSEYYKNNNSSREKTSMFVYVRGFRKRLDERAARQPREETKDRNKAMNVHALSRCCFFGFISFHK